MAKKLVVLRKKLKKIGNSVQKINLFKLIGEMEKDQDLAYELEHVNESVREENARKDICRRAQAECLRDITEHLEHFISKHPCASYEDWIMDLHPDNALDYSNGEALIHTRSGNELFKIDHRFYVEDSDHRKIWNNSLGDDSSRTYVSTRNDYFKK